MGARVRVLGEEDRPQVKALLDRDPLHNLFVASRVEGLGIDPIKLSCPLFGFEQDGEITALCHAGANLVPINTDDESRRAFAETLGGRCNSTSIMGRSDQVMAFYQTLVDQWGGTWAQSREIRDRQPLLAISQDSLVDPDQRIQRITHEHYEPYFDAAVAMFTEEVGVSPLAHEWSYRYYINSLIDLGRAIGGVNGQSVWFKSDIGSACGEICQIQGVWIAPELRGRWLSIPAMAQVIRLAREEFPTVTLYVNDFNIRALRLYARVGFEVVGEMATVLYE